MKLLWKQLTLLFSEQYLRYGANQNDQIKPEVIILLKRSYYKYAVSTKSPCTNQLIIFKHYNSNTINNLSGILKKITSNTYSVSSSNKEYGNELILENNTDHIDSKNEIVHELLDVKFEHLQRRYQHLLDQSPNQPEQTISNDQCINGSNVTKGYKVIESNIQNQELNKVTPPLNKVPSFD